VLNGFVPGCSNGKHLSDGPVDLPAGESWPSSGGFLRARDNPGDLTTWTNAWKWLLTCAVG
jgi:hypothetical protein